MKIDRKLSTSSIDAPPAPAFEQTRNLSGAERISMLEELRYDLGEIAGYDYSQRLERSVSVISREQC